MALPENNKLMIMRGIRLVLEGLGEDPDREGLRDTPRRVAKMYSDILDGRFDDMARIAKFQDEDETVIDSTVMVHHVPFYAMCEHHMAVFYGQFGVAYQPSDALIGLSKLVRVFRHFAKFVTIQERLTQQTADALQKMLNPKGIVVYVCAEHTCMSLRGVKSPGSKTTTIATRGVFTEDSSLTEQFLRIAQ